MIPSPIYSGMLKSVPYGSIKPPAAEPEKFIADVERRCPSVNLFPLKNSKILVLGIFPDHFHAYADEQNWTIVNRLWDGSNQKIKRSHNSLTNCSQRPSLWHMRGDDGKEFYVFCTEPCREGVCHWASMIDQLFRSHEIGIKIIAKCHEGSAQKFITSALGASGVVEQLNILKKLYSRRVVLILGYATMVESALNPIRNHARFIECGPYFALKIWEDANGAPIVAMSVRFSFRGTLGRELVGQLIEACDLGGILFVSKVAQHISQNYQGCLVPHAFTIISPEGKLPSPLISTTPLLPRWVSRAVLMSYGTTLLPSSLLELGMQQGANMTSTEIAYMAQGSLERKVPFQAICLASQNPRDYLPILSVIFNEVGELGKSRICRQLSGKISPRYSGVYDGPLKLLPLHPVQPEAHSMGEDITYYARCKGPAVNILNERPVKVLGIAPEDISSYTEERGWKINSLPLWEGGNRMHQSFNAAYMPPKIGNTQRPSLFQVTDEKGSEFLLLATMPSEELVHHWGMLIKQYFPKVEAGYHQGSVERYAQKCFIDSGLIDKLKTHAEWSSGEAVLVMGYSHLTAQYLCSAGYRSPYSVDQEYEFLDQKGGISYCLLKKENCRPVFLINIEFCYWGGLSGGLALAILRTGKLYGLAHIAKAGQMAGRDSLNHIYLPRSFSIAKPSGEIEGIHLTSHLFSTNHFEDNGLSGDHVSVSSIFFETLNVVEEVKANGAVTMDVEGAHFCVAAVKANVKFGAIYYASDSLRCDKTAVNETDSVSLVSDVELASTHKEKMLREGILYRLMPALHIKN